MDNPMEILAIGSKSEPFVITNESDLKNKITNGYVVVYQHNAILIGRVENNEFVFADDSKFVLKRVQKMRVFNQNEELLVWQTKDGLKGRHRQDNEGENCHKVDAKQVLIGTRKEGLGNSFCKVTEDRGFELVLPYIGFKMPKNGNHRIAVITRNYIGYTDSGVAGYVDCRFVDLVQF